jgi:hypothetical protein
VPSTRRASPDGPDRHLTDAARVAIIPAPPGPTGLRSAHHRDRRSPPEITLFTTSSNSDFLSVLTSFLEHSVAGLPAYAGADRPAIRQGVETCFNESILQPARGNRGPGFPYGEEDRQLLMDRMAELHLKVRHGATELDAVTKAAQGIAVLGQHAPLVAELTLVLRPSAARLEQLMAKCPATLSVDDRPLVAQACRLAWTLISLLDVQRAADEASRAAEEVKAVILAGGGRASPADPTG